MKSVKLSVILLLATLGLIGSASAVTIYPCDDMYIDTLFTDPHDSTVLFIASDPVELHINDILMKFDLEPYMGTSIDEAVLWVYRFYGCGQGDTDARIYHITQPWDEQTWPEDSCICYDETTWSQRIFNIIGWNPIDVTYLVQSWLDGAMPNYGMAIVGAEGTRMSKLYSCEANNDFKPYLEIPSITAIDVEASLPVNFHVTAYPNPFNAQVTISYTLIQPSQVKLEIFDILGNRVASLFSGISPAGNSQITWNAKDMSSGVYFYRIIIDKHSQTEKIILLK